MNSTQMKNKKKNLKSSKLMSDRLALNWTEKVKELKTWAQVKSPKSFQPALSYALDWLVPELLGTGFRLYEISDLQMKGLIPADRKNLDSQFQIHQGLVLNAALEISKTYIQRQMPDRFFQLVASEMVISKKHKWSEDLHLFLKTSAGELDDFFMELQKNKKAEIVFEIRIESSAAAHEKFKKNDLVKVSMTIEITDLIA